tara:strand:- start:1329 stop:2276 length:948 start_codon:yes stop_codon:yes gene_type:complete
MSKEQIIISNSHIKNTIILEEKHFSEGLSESGGYKKKQLEILNLNWPLVKGWKEKVIGKRYKKKQINDFINYNKNKNHSILEFFKMSNDELNELKEVKDELTKKIYVYTDGSCIYNGKPNAKAGIGVFFGENDPRNVSERIEGKQSNNTAELKAIIKAIHILDTDISLGHKIIIYSDSLYSIRGATTYGRKMQSQQWRKRRKGTFIDIPNKDLIKQLYTLYTKYKNVELKHIKAHTNKQDKHSIGNDWADKLANRAIDHFITIDHSDRIYLNVPYSEKEGVKKYGGRWDKDKKKWYIMKSIGELNKHFVMEKWGN